MADRESSSPRPPQRPASDPLPDGTTSEPPSAEGRSAQARSAHARSTDADDTPRTPDEYMERPGSHRRPDGAATDVGA